MLSGIVRGEEFFIGGFKVMRVLQVVTRLDDYGGAQSHVLSLVKKLQENRDTCLLLGGCQGEIDWHFKSDEFRVRKIRTLVRPIAPVRDLLAILEVRKLIKNYRPDILCLHSSKAGAIGRLAALGLKIPVVFTAHGWAFTEGVSPLKQFTFKIFEKVLARFTTVIITVSAYDRDLALRCRVAEPGKVVVIHNGVEDITLASEKPSNRGPRIVMVARFDEPKDQMLLLRALEKLRDIDWQLDLIGDGPKRSSLRGKAEQLGLESRVIFLGSVHNVHQYISMGDIFVLASKWEGLPISVIEAMQVGLPVICSNVGGVSEIVRHGQTGYLVRAGSVDDLKRKLEDLIMNPSRRLAMGQAGRELYERELKQERMMQKTLEVYRKAIALYLER